MDSERTGSLNQSGVWSMLCCIPADDRDTWLKVGMALHSEFGDDGFPVWDAWSQSADNYDPRAARDVWRSLKAGAVSGGTLVYLARQCGWTPDSPVERRLPTVKTKPRIQKRRHDTSMYARQLWLASNPDDKAVAGHHYARPKDITHAGGAARGIASGRVIGRNADCIIVPIRNIQTGKIQAVQCINSAGKKQTFGPVSGGCLLLGNTLEKHRYPWYVAEGWASAFSMVFHHQSGDGVCAAAFGKSNLDAVAHALADTYAPDEIVILRERD